MHADVQPPSAGLDTMRRRQLFGWAKDPPAARSAAACFVQTTPPFEAPPHPRVPQPPLSTFFLSSGDSKLSKIKAIKNQFYNSKLFLIFSSCTIRFFEGKRGRIASRTRRPSSWLCSLAQRKGRCAPHRAASPALRAIRALAPPSSPRRRARSTAAWCRPRHGPA